MKINRCSILFPLYILVLSSIFIGGVLSSIFIDIVLGKPTIVTPLITTAVLMVWVFYEDCNHNILSRLERLLNCKLEGYLTCYEMFKDDP